MSQIEIAVTLSRRLESLLEEKHQASGKGLHEKVSSVEGRLPADLVKSLRYIATMRNSVVHQDGFVIDDIDGFSAQGNVALERLGGQSMSAGTFSGRLQAVWLYMQIGFIALCGLGGAFLMFHQFGSVGGAVGGFIGGGVIALWIISWIGKALAFVFGLFLLGAAIATVVAMLQWLGVMPPSVPRGTQPHHVAAAVHPGRSIDGGQQRR